MKTLNQQQIETLVFAREEIERMARRHAAIAKTLAKCEDTKEKVSRKLAEIKAMLKAGTATEKQAGSVHGYKLQVVLLRRSIEKHREEMGGVRAKAAAELAALAGVLPDLAAGAPPTPKDCAASLRTAAAAITATLGDGAAREALAAQSGEAKNEEAAQR